MSINIVAGEVRLSYVHVLRPYATRENEEPKYSLTLLIPKTNGALVQQITDAINQAIQEGVAGKFNGVAPAQPPTPLHDGDGVKRNGEAYGPECQGHYVMTVGSSAEYPPDVVAGQDRHKVINPAEIYSGCYGYVSLQFYAYNYNGTKGIGCGLGNVWKTRDGEPLGGNQRTAADDFAGLNVQVPAAAPAAAPQQTYADPGWMGGQQPAAAVPGQAPVMQPVAPAPGTVVPGQAPVAPVAQPVQPVQPAYPAQPQINPVTGQPVTGVLGIDN